MQRGQASQQRRTRLAAVAGHPRQLARARHRCCVESGGAGASAGPVGAAGEAGLPDRVDARAARHRARQRGHQREGGCGAHGAQPRHELAAAGRAQVECAWRACARAVILPRCSTDALFLCGKRRLHLLAALMAGNRRRNSTHTKEQPAGWDRLVAAAIGYQKQLHTRHLLGAGCCSW